MRSFLKSHPFAVDAFFERSVVLAYAFSVDTLRPLVPDCLELDTFDGKWAFCAVAMVKTKDMRPSGLPTWMGRDFSLIGYRIFVRYKTSDGRDLRGLYILRSETDRCFMKLSGNLFTRYNYQHTDVQWNCSEEKIRIDSTASKLKVHVMSSKAEPKLPEGSPFSSWKEARRFAGPMPYTFSLKPGGEEMIIIKGVRSNWQPQALEVCQHNVGFLGDMNLTDGHLANAFMVTDVPYRWERGRCDTVPMTVATP